MRKKILLGVMIVTSLSVAVGGHFFATTNAQDPPKQAEPDKKSEGDLFRTIVQSLESKKGAPALPPPTVQQPVIAPPPLPMTNNGLAPLPAPVSGPLAQVTVGAQEPPISVPPPSAAKDPLPAFPPANKDPVSVTPPPGAPIPPPALPQSAKPMAPLPPVANQPPLGTFGPDLSRAPQPMVPVAPQKITDDLAKVKDCPWTMHVELINGQTVVTATVNQKNEFKIVCQNLDLQTGKGALKAIGKVQITGDMMTGSCEQLSISLSEDRLLLEGTALVSIQKLSGNVSSEKPASFELKGTTLDLRISELQAKFRQTSLSVERESGAVSPRSAAMIRGTDNDAKQWSPYGKLSATKDSLPTKELLWRLEGSDGKLISYLVARDGGTLAQFEGQNISVLGASEQFNGRPVLRVTHIALP